MFVVTSRRGDLPRQWMEEEVEVFQVDRESPNTKNPDDVMAYSRAVAEQVDALHQETPLDVVHVPEWGAEGWAFRPSKDTVFSVFFQAASHIVWEHEYGEGSAREWQVSELERGPVERADLLSTPSQMMVDRIAKTWCFDRDSVVRLPQPMDLTGFEATEEPSSAEGPVILSVNRLTPIKGPDVLVQAAALVHERFPSARFRFVGRGGDWDGEPAEQALEKLARRVGLPEDRLEFAGPRPRAELSEEFAKATLCVNPSVSESYSYTSAEALASGRALVLTEGQGIREDLRDREDCLVVPPRDAGALAEAICELLSDEELRRTMAAKGRQAVEERIVASVALSRLEGAFFDCRDRISERKEVEPCRINVAILTHNALDHTKKCLASLEAHTPIPHNIFVVDNASTDGSADWLKAQESDRVHVHLSESNLGVPGGRNRLLKLILPHLPEDGLIVFLDNDIEVSGGWMDEALQTFDDEPEVGIVGAMGHPILIEGEERTLYPMPEDGGPVDVVSGGFACWVRSDAAWEVGRFDEKLGKFWHEDDDYCVRAHQLGYGVSVVPNEHLVHHEHQSGVAHATTANRASLENQSYLIRKWRERGWVDERGKIVRPGSRIGTGESVRRKVEASIGSPLGIPEEEWLESSAILYDLSRDDEGLERFTRKRRPLAKSFYGLLDANLERAKESGNRDLARVLERLQQGLNQLSYRRELLEKVLWPQFPAQAPKTGVRISKICRSDDWEDPDWLQVAREVLDEGSGANFYRRHRQTWEYVQLVYGLLRLGRIHEEATGLSVGAGREPLLFPLAQRVGKLVAVDRYDRESQAKFGIDPEFPERAPSVAPSGFPRNRLEVRRMDARRLEFEDETFDFVYSAASLPHFGGYDGARQALAEMARVVKPGGIVALSTDLLLNRGSDGERFCRETIGPDLIAGSGLSLVEEIDFSTDESTLEGFSDCPDNASRTPHFVHRAGASLMTSLVVFLERVPVLSEDDGFPETPEFTSPAGDSAPKVEVSGSERATPVSSFSGSRTVGTAKIGIDVRCLAYDNSADRGVGCFTRRHLEAVVSAEPEWSFVCYGENDPPAGLEELFDRENVSYERADDYGSGQVDLIHVPDPMNLSLGFDSPLRVFRQCPTTVLMHDLLPFRVYWEKWPKDRKLAYLSRLHQLGEGDCEVFTTTEFTKRDLLSCVDMDSSRVRAIYGGGQGDDSTSLSSREVDLLKRKLGIHGPYFLHVGALDPHKNFDEVVRAFLEVQKERHCQLVVVGERKEFLKGYEDLFKARGLDSVVFTGFVSKSILGLLYREAVACLCFSVYEGLSLVALEAMEAGCPVIASRSSSFPEVAGGAMIHVDPRNGGQAGSAMMSLLRSPERRAELAEKGRARGSQFTWERTAHLTVEVWKTLIASSRERRGSEPRAEGDWLPSEEFGEDAAFGPCPPSLTPTAFHQGAPDRISNSPGGCAPSANAQPSERLRLGSGLRGSSPGTGGSGKEELAIVWNAPLLDPSGYADEARQFVLGLDAIGQKVAAAPLNWNLNRVVLKREDRARLDRLVEVHFEEGKQDLVNVFHIFPQYFKRNPLAWLNVGRTTFETDRIPERWVEACNAMDEVWVPSDFNLTTFRESGVDANRLFKIPAAIDADAYSGEVEPLLLSDERGFNFLCVFDWSLRKGWDVLLRAYVEEFREEEDVALTLKVSSSLGLNEDRINLMIQSFVENHLGRDPGTIPDVIVLQQDLSQEMVPSLYRSMDAYVMASRGEGWGRPYMEAMAMGLPTIGTGWGGNTEFMSATNSYLIESDLVEVPEAAVREAPHFRGHRWAEPSVAHLRSLMREVFEDREGARERGARAREEILCRYSRQQVAGQVVDRIEALRGMSPALS